MVKLKHLKLIIIIVILLFLGFINTNIVLSLNRIPCFNQCSERFQLSISIDSSHPDHYDFLEAWDTGPGQDVKIGPDGNIYLSSGPNIYIYDINGNLIDQWTYESPINDINGIDFDSQGYLYAMESTSNQVVKIDSQGNVVLTWGSTGEGVGQFMLTNRIACDSQDNVYVVDYNLNRIQKFDSNSNFIRFLNLPTASSVGSLTIDSQDFIYTASDLFRKYDHNGTFIKEWGTPLTEHSFFSNPHGLAVDNSDALYVTEIGTPRVQKFDSNGTFITEFGSDGGLGQLSLPTGITIANNGLVYVIDVKEDEGHIQIYTPKTESQSTTEQQQTATTTVIYPSPQQDMPSLITTIIIPIPVAIVLLGLLFWINRFVRGIEEDNMITSKE